MINTNLLFRSFRLHESKRNTFPATLVRSSPVARYRKLACQLPKSAKCKHSAHYSTPVNGQCSVLPLTALFTRLSKCMVYARLRVPVRSGVPAVLSSRRPCVMRPARLFGLQSVRAPHGFLFWFTVQFRGSRFRRFACLLTLKSISHFRLFVKNFFRSFLFRYEAKTCQSLLTLWIIAHSKLFVKNFFRRREISGFPLLRLYYRTAAMPCTYWFRLCVPLTAVSGRPVSQSVTNSILTASRLCYIQSMPFGVPAVGSSTVCMIPYAAPFVNKYFSLFCIL